MATATDWRPAFASIAPVPPELDVNPDNLDPLEIYTLGWVVCVACGGSGLRMVCWLPELRIDLQCYGCAAQYHFGLGALRDVLMTYPGDPGHIETQVRLDRHEPEAE